jgi:membrane protein YdbS with pleckstrin-like domain
MTEPTFPSLYSNLQIDKSQLPDAELLQFEPIQRRYLWKVRLKYLLAPVPPILAWIFEWALPAYLWVATGVWVFLVGISFVLQTLSFFQKGYAIREKDLSFRTGWLFRSITTIPFNRIQHCEIERSFFERLFNLSTLNVYTAGGSGSDISIPGLPPEDAQKLRTFIIETAASHEEQ